MEKSPKELYQERVRRFNDAVGLRVPDRVPIASLAAFFMTRYSGLSNKEAMYDYERMADAWKQSAKKLNWDMAPPPFTMFPGPVMEILGLKQLKWPGCGLADNLPYQYVQAEYMMADEYDKFLQNPGDFTVRTVMPRISKAMEPLASIPPLHWLTGCYTMVMLGATFAGIPPIVQTMETIMKAGAEMAKWNAVQAKLTQDLEEMGFPMITAGFAVSPYDWITDMLRGLKGIMLDMYRNPDKLLAAIDLLTPMWIETAIMGAKQSGNPRIFMPLHRGASGFMSNEQFAKFYRSEERRVGKECRSRWSPYH